MPLLFVLALTALGLSGPHSLSAFALSAQAGSSPHAHQQTGVASGQAECPPAAAAQPGTGAAQADGAPAPALVEPPVISSQDGVLRTTLTVAEQNVPAGDQTVLGRVYNGGFVGPTLRVRPGDQIELTTLAGDRTAIQADLTRLGISTTDGHQSSNLDLILGRGAGFGFGLGFGGHGGQH